LGKEPDSTKLNEAAPAKVTIRTVASDAGVSVAAVSKVLRNAYGVSAALRQKVQSSIDRLGYRPSTAARGMRGRTYTVGVLVVELRNPFLPDVIDSINATLGAAGYKALIGVGQSRAALESAMVESMIAHGMDGLVLIAPRLPPDVIRSFARVIPIVLVGHHLRGETGFDTVNTDDALGAELAVRELISLGHRRIGMLSLADRSEGEVSMQRELGYRRAMAAAGLPEGGILRLPRGGVRCPDELAAWLDAPDRASAVFCWSDLTAVDLLGLAAERGIGVPGDLSVVGFDNSRIAALPQIALTSIDQGGATLGSLVGEVLLERINGRTEPRHDLVAPTLVRRDSVSVPEGRAGACST
jgi:LacI family transcriptional regulator